SFRVPVSRWTEVPRAAIAGEADLVILADSDIAGVCLAQDRAGRNIYMFNHFEYDADTLAWEYARDQEAGGAPKVPANYFPGDDPTRTPRNTWRSHAQLLYGNWINAVYQMTPFDRQAIGGG
ncbi:MAG: homoserine O-succinyltransferase, partial [Pseudomonadota bacterium]|nr:homoserine O-succinyltransferase [Pseudomonadota bacterium]